MKEITFDFSKGEYAEDLIDEKLEKQAANQFEWHPTPPITIESVVIDMADEFNGLVEIKLSNGHIVTYTCEEFRSNRGPAYTTKVTVYNFGYTGYQIAGDEFLEEFAGSGSWINDIMNCYVDYHKNK